MIEKTCFAYKKENDQHKCHALNEIDCNNCRFYQKRSEIINNPFYGYSYKDKEKLRCDMKQHKLTYNDIIW